MAITDIFRLPGLSASTGGTGMISNLQVNDAFSYSDYNEPVQNYVAPVEETQASPPMMVSSGGAFILGMIILGMSGFRGS